LRHTYVTGDGDPFTMVELVRGLRRGELLALLADVAWDSRWVDVPFFGRPTRFPVGPARLARLAEVPIFPAFCVWEGTRKFVCSIGDPIEVGGPDPLEAERAAVAKLAAVIERVVTDQIEQWFNFTAVWDPPP
jgi:KDO2-lipid IV(A) lauroyltransferase